MVTLAAVARAVERKAVVRAAAEPMTTSLAVRLRRLPHNMLAELAAQLCCENDAARRATDECIAGHDPLPQWAVDEVLLSSDLLRHVMVSLDTWDGAFAVVCSAWSQVWASTSDLRRGLRELAGGAARCSRL